MQYLIFLALIFIFAGSIDQMDCADRIPMILVHFNETTVYCARVSNKKYEFDWDTSVWFISNYACSNYDYPLSFKYEGSCRNGEYSCDKCNVFPVYRISFTSGVMIPDYADLILKHCQYSYKNEFMNVKTHCDIVGNERHVQISSTHAVCTEWAAMTEERGNGAAICGHYTARDSQLPGRVCSGPQKCADLCKMSSDLLLFSRVFFQHFKNDTSELNRMYGNENEARQVQFGKDLDDKCVSIPGVCESSNYCADPQSGYECRTEDLNAYNCSLVDHSNNNSIRCRYENVLESIESETSSKKKFQRYRSYFFRIQSNLTNNFQGQEENTTNLILKPFQKAFLNATNTFTNNTNTPFVEKWNEIYTYCRLANEIEIEIPLGKNAQASGEEFVKLLLDHRNNLNNNDILAFTRYENMDVAGESTKLTEMIGKLSPVPNQSDWPNQIKIMRFRNSDMIFIHFSHTSEITFQYKLNKLINVQAPSWLYSFEDECGYLELDRWTWAVDGCRKVDKPGQSYCECDHLSNFAMLFSMKLINEHHLLVFQSLSIIGGIINLISFLLFLIFVLFINTRDKLRIDQLNIAICLLAGTLTFLLGGLAAGNYYPCKFMALLSQYLLLSAFVWMLILGINVVRMVISTNLHPKDWMVKYRILLIIIGYSVPFVIVASSGYFNWLLYGEVFANVCWIKNENYALLTFIVPVGIILAINIIGMFLIANNLIRNYFNVRQIRVTKSNELLVLLQLMASMGFTWFPSYFAIQYLAAMYLFVICFPLQGLMMFLCVVLFNKENRLRFLSYISQTYSSFIPKTPHQSAVESQKNSDFKSAPVRNVTGSKMYGRNANQMIIEDIAAT